MAIVGAIVAFGLVYYVLPRAAGLESTLKQLRSGDAWWLALACLLEAGSISGEVVLLRGIFSTPVHPLSWRSITQVTLARAAATKLVATAGAGGIALTVWALRAFRVPGREVADGMVSYELVTYAVYMAAVVVAGLGLWIGLFAGRAPVGVTLIPAAVAAGAIAIVLSMSFVEERAERWLRRRAERSEGGRAR
jgi:uncharacterized membrane protein YbhN (UPF0104 family)